MDKTETLLNNFKEFFASGEDNLKKQRYNAATDSFFKAVTTLCDYGLFQKIRFLPKNHDERFVLLEINYPIIYSDVSKLFSRYRKTYTMKSDLDDAKITKEVALKIVNEFKLKKEVQGLLEQE